MVFSLLPSSRFLTGDLVINGSLYAEASESGRSLPLQAEPLLRASNLVSGLSSSIADPVSRSAEIYLRERCTLTVAGDAQDCACNAYAYESCSLPRPLDFMLVWVIRKANHSGDVVGWQDIELLYHMAITARPDTDSAVLTN